MGIPVTVDSEDLGSMLYATAAIKQIGAAVAVKDSMAMSQRLPAVEAQERLERAWRTAQRRADYPERYVPVMPWEISALIDLWPRTPRQDGESADEYQVRLIDRFLPKRAIGANDPDLRKLMTRGLIEFGVRRDALIWGTTGDITVRDDPECWIRIAPSCIDAIKKYEGETVLEAKPV